MKYMVVEKDDEESEGYLHPEVYDNLEDARKKAESLDEGLGEYYKVFVVEAYI